MQKNNIIIKSEKYNHEKFFSEVKKMKNNFFEKVVDGVVKSDEENFKIILDAPFFLRVIKLEKNILKFFSKPNSFRKYTLIMFKNNIIAIKCNCIKIWVDLKNNVQIEDIEEFKMRFLTNERQIIKNNIKENIDGINSIVSLVIDTSSSDISKSVIISDLNEKFSNLIDNIEKI